MEHKLELISEIFVELTFAKIFDACRSFDINDNIVIVETPIE